MPPGHGGGEPKNVVVTIKYVLERPMILFSPMGIGRPVYFSGILAEFRIPDEQALFREVPAITCGFTTFPYSGSKPSGR